MTDDPKREGDTAEDDELVADEKDLPEEVQDGDAGDEE